VARKQAIIEAFPAMRPEISAAVLRAMGEFNGTAVLSRATVPVLSIGSAGPANSAADLRRACPAITIGQTVGSGHFIQLEVPAQVNAMIEQFLAITDLPGMRKLRSLIRYPPACAHTTISSSSRRVGDKSECAARQLMTHNQAS
jgi:hypothetical protein